MKYNPPGNRYIWETTTVTLYKDGRKVEETRRNTARCTVTDKQRQVNDSATRLCREIAVAAVYVQAKIVDEYTNTATAFVLTAAKVKKGWEKDIGEPELMPGMTSRFTGDAGAKGSDEESETRQRRSGNDQKSNRTQSDSGRTRAPRERPMGRMLACETLLKFAREENIPANRLRLIDDAVYQKTIYRQAAKNTHPDVGGAHHDFIAVQHAWEYLRQSDPVR